ncbi:AbrB/MazE/SpoVT family DNA-binding domain-containing protein [Lysinibacillus sp. CNPSo 3705]|uniref:AbrB/MazE/SpoVT family DNA-binding domain-containing protein n=1 Tax=Lysinibacillus sp. CNPSo 3705 TaxID=3028148 RepID=UPI0023646339|nr:AbrB/MazE/SpoVT family DNA-binding domain-containing protein [Lysinibacillus sp. CNPSo 3705]MDD1505400.1 AbrB/MazE/SpoVT family DNA-binding domain-containing protein [Lysinibacillus sp. CNPSo 3705]
MKSTGIVRKVDELGRIVIPIELRKNLHIQEKDPVEVFVEKDSIILKKYTPNMTCAITGEVSDENIKLLNGELILSPLGGEYLIQEIKLALQNHSSK